MIAAQLNVNRVFHALCDPTRRAIVEQLGKRGPLSASALAAPMGITVTAILQHLRVLEDCRLVHTEKVGRVRDCRVDPRGLSVLTKWVDAQRSIWERRLDTMSTILDEGVE